MAPLAPPPRIRYCIVKTTQTLTEFVEDFLAEHLRNDLFIYLCECIKLTVK